MFFRFLDPDPMNISSVIRTKNNNPNIERRGSSCYLFSDIMMQSSSSVSREGGVSNVDLFNEGGSNTTPLRAGFDRLPRRRILDKYAKLVSKRYGLIYICCKRWTFLGFPRALHIVRINRQGTCRIETPTLPQRILHITMTAIRCPLFQFINESLFNEYLNVNTKEVTCGYVLEKD